MPDSVLDPSVLSDVLSGVVDAVRGEIHGALGTRPYRVYVVTRTWSGPTRGEGSHVETEMELLPPPMVRFTSLHAEAKDAGREEEGSAEISEISLRYSERELWPNFNPLVEWAIRIDDSRGTGWGPRFFFPEAPPRARRGDQAGDGQDWVLQVKRVLDMTSGDVL